MARLKATTTDIHARLAKGECANYRNARCHGTSPCTIINGEPCTYFATYVLPLLEYPEVSAKYSREAKITVALNPQAKVIRKRRLAREPKLALESSPAPSPSQPTVVPPIPDHPRETEMKAVPVNAVPTPKPRAEKAVTTVVTVSGQVKTKPRDVDVPTNTASNSEPPLLLLELTPSEPVKRKSARKRYRG